MTATLGEQVEALRLGRSRGRLGPGDYERRLAQLGPIAPKLARQRDREDRYGLVTLAAGLEETLSGMADVVRRTVGEMRGPAK